MSWYDDRSLLQGILLILRTNTTLGLLRVLCAHLRIFDAQGPTSDESPPLEVLLYLGLHAASVVFRFPVVSCILAPEVRSLPSTWGNAGPSILRFLRRITYLI